MPTAHIDCKDNESNKQEFLDCLEDSLEYQTALRCLDDSENAVEAVTDGLMCISEAQQNATMVIKNLLGLEIEKVSEMKLKFPYYLKNVSGCRSRDKEVVKIQEVF